MSALSEFLELRKLEYKHIWLFISGFLGTLAPGMLIIFHFKPDLMEKYDIVKVACFSLTLTLPLLLINSINTSLLYHNLPDEADNNESDSKNVEVKKNIDITKGALQLNAVVIYSSILICYFCSLKFKWFLGLTFSFEIALFLFGLFQLLTNQKSPSAH